MNLSSFQEKELEMFLKEFNEEFTGGLNPETTVNSGVTVADYGKYVSSFLLASHARLVGEIKKRIEEVPCEVLVHGSPFEPTAGDMKQAILSLLQDIPKEEKVVETKELGHE